MPNIFSRNSVSSEHLKRKKAEKKRRLERERAWRKKQRREAWQSFVKRTSNFLAHPFGKPKSPHYRRQRELEKKDRIRIRAEKKRIRARERSWRRRQRAEAWKSFRSGLIRFLSNPFAKRQLTEAQRERRRMKAHARR